MGSPKVSEKDFIKVVTEYDFNLYRAAQAMDMDHSAVCKRWRRIRGKKDFQIHLPPPEQSLDELLDRRKRQYKQKKDYQEGKRLIKVNVKDDKPIAILHLGDPHVDDDGTDLQMLEDHVNLANKTEGMYIANVGDTTNNWVGRLARLYSEQSTSASEAWLLAEWFLNLIKPSLLYCIGGNHDAWSGAGDPITWILGKGEHLYLPSEVRLNLVFDNEAEVRVNARHDFKGHSMWNPAHAVGKASTMGTRDHIVICGHKHTSGYMPLKDANTGIIMHGIQVASYKIYDRYALERGFRDNHFSPCAITIIDPTKEDAHPDMIKVYWDPFEAADILTYMRKRS